MFRAWNATFAADPCRHPLLAGMPTHRLYLFDPPNGVGRPIYRYMPNVTTPAGLVTNEIGWRGPPLRHKKPGTIRIVFVGASTTAEAHETPYSYPELIGQWLGLWAAAHGLDLDFQALNAGREGMTSTDIAAIVRDEVAPMRPDLVVYYEGANQFDLSSIARGAEGGLSGRTTLPVDPPSWLATAARHSEIAVRLRAALTLIGDSGNGREPAKPPTRSNGRRDWTKPTPTSAIRRCRSTSARSCATSTTCGPPSVGSVRSLPSRRSSGWCTTAWSSTRCAAASSGRT